MTLRQIFEEMEHYNDISSQVGNDELAFYFTDFFTYKFYGYHDFHLWLIENCVDEVIDIVMNTDYEFMSMINNSCDMRFVFERYDEYNVSMTIKLKGD